jgi:hypothetical protein
MKIMLYDEAWHFHHEKYKGQSEKQFTCHNFTTNKQTHTDCNYKIMEIFFFPKKLPSVSSNQKKYPGSHKFKCGGKMETVVTRCLVTQNTE